MVAYAPRVLSTEEENNEMSTTEEEEEVYQTGPIREVNDRTVVPILAMILNVLCAQHTEAASVANGAAMARTEGIKATSRSLSEAAIAAAESSSAAFLDAVAHPTTDRLSAAAATAVTARSATHLAKVANKRARAPPVLIPVSATSLPSWDQRVSIFFSVAIPAVDLTLYMRRLVGLCKLSPTVVVVALVLLHRAREADGRLALSGWNVHRLMLTALLVASKTVEERSYCTSYFARIGGVGSAMELVRLEWVFLELLEWRCQVNERVLAVAQTRMLQRYHECIERDLPGARLAMETAAEIAAEHSSGEAGQGY